MRLKEERNFCRGVGGFTLMELLVAAVLMSVVGGAILASFGGGIRVFDKVRDFGTIRSRVALALEVMERRIRDGVRFDPVGFEGASDTMAFAVTRERLVGERLERRLARQRYYRDAATGELVSAWIDYPFESSDEEHQETLAEIEGLRFEYAYKEGDAQGYQWKDAWDPTDGRPVAVRLEVRFKDKGGIRSVERVVVIPTV